LQARGDRTTVIRSLGGDTTIYRGIIPSGDQQFKLFVSLDIEGNVVRIAKSITA
jgi:hypothetical protein